MPIRTALSGPAAGVVGAVAAGARSGRRDLITFDMGGTSTDVCLVRDGKPRWRSAAASPAFRCGCPPSIFTPSGPAAGPSPTSARRPHAVGPVSTGADPGPRLLWQGRPRADCLGRQSRSVGCRPELIGGGMRLDPAAAEAAIAPLAAKLGLASRETALGIVRIVNANMMRAIRVVSIERGHDPRIFTLMPFGGAGALHAVEIARELGIRRSWCRRRRASSAPRACRRRAGGELRRHLPRAARRRSWRPSPAPSAG